ncbi:MAG: M81 family metallopeptidase [Spirochaetaceae bacterium]|jgi:microcystin degradation protein MlrC|nr:M81 family metallopeptidase [Spirochaetaceae bacterium]
MRILSGGISHESNSLNPIITGEDDFVVLRGNEISRRSVFSRHSSAGIIETLQKGGAEVIPTVLARAVPNGVVSAAFYGKIKAEMLQAAGEALKQGPIDGVCLALHGSMKVEGGLCAEGDLCLALRDLLPGIPFTAALDMHATITPALLRAVDGFAGYKTAPHVDSFETGVLAARMLLETLKTRKKLYTASRSVPVMIAGEKSESAAEPMASLLETCKALERDSGTDKTAILAASILLGFPWADCEYNAVTILVSAFTENRAAADKAARDLAEAFWRRRKEFSFRTECYNSREALAAACTAVLEKGERPVFVSDSGDNPTAGAAGDATEVLEEILRIPDRIEKLPTPLLYSGFYDAPAVAACVQAGEGAEIAITLGGNWDKLNGKKLPFRVRVEKTVRDYGPYKSDLALVRPALPSADLCNILISVTSKHIGFGDENLLPALGINAADYCLVVVKLGYLEPCFRKIAARAIMAASRGCSNEILETIPYEKVKRPLYPLDPGMEWTPVV